MGSRGNPSKDTSLETSGMEGACGHIIEVGELPLIYVRCLA